ncbi:MAG: hypothetical protein P4L98_06410 [Ancalomicrobiaceae bacterium]|nr:hypothetical protein [Ancalomicrobiaceae bacterium]
MLVAIGADVHQPRDVYRPGAIVAFEAFPTLDSETVAELEIKADCVLARLFATSTGEEGAAD